MERETLAHALSATLLHVMLLREQGDTVEAERIMKELLNAFDQANQATREGRKVWKRLVGPIPDGYHIHHLDGNPANNSLDNLQMLSASDHAKLHHPANPIPRGGRAARVRYQKEYMKTYVRKRRVVSTVPSLQQQPTLGS